MRAMRKTQPRRKNRQAKKPKRIGSVKMQRVGAATLKCKGAAYRVTLYIPRSGGNFGIVKGLKSE